MNLRLLFGGTFDPVHEGHLAVARAVAEHLDAEVFLLPSADPPHRPPPGASAADRARMVALAIAGEPRLRLDARELGREGRSYTVDTLAEIRDELGPDLALAWVLGADAFRGLPQWHRWRELFGLAHWVVVHRPGYALDSLPPELSAACDGRWCERAEELRQSAAGRILALALPPRPESASAIRARLGAGQSVAGELPAAVATYIRERGLYAGSTV